MAQSDYYITHSSDRTPGRPLDEEEIAMYGAKWEMDT